MADDNPTQEALVLTGTGANAAFEAGVLQGLLGDKWGREGNPPVQPFCYAGTSTGALNAAAMVSMAHLSNAESLRRLEDMWLNRIAASSGSATGLFRIRGDFTQYMQPKYSADFARPFVDLAVDSLHVLKALTQRVAVAASTSNTVPDGIVQLGEFCELLDISPLRELAAEVVDTAQIAGGKCRLRITAVDWLRGTARTFENSHFENSWAPGIVVAAQAMPGVVPAEILDGLPYVDSCVLFDKQLKPAIQAADNSAGAKPLVLHVAYVDAGMRDIPTPAIPNTFSTLYRLYMLALSRSVLSDIGRADAMNERLWMKDMLATVLEASGKHEDSAEEDEFGSGGIEKRTYEDLEGKRAITIHRYAPKEHIYGFELRQFDRGTIGQLIRHGQDVAKHHDCDEAGCIKPQRTGRALRIP